MDQYLLLLRVLQTGLRYPRWAFTQPPLKSGIDRHRFPLRSWFQPYLAWMCICFFTLVLIFNGFTAFIGGFNISDFFASYVTLPLIALCWIGFKLVRKTHGVKPADVDLSGGPAEALRGTQYDRVVDVRHEYAGEGVTGDEEKV